MVGQRPTGDGAAELLPGEPSLGCSPSPDAGALSVFSPWSFLEVLVGVTERTWIFAAFFPWFLAGLLTVFQADFLKNRKNSSSSAFNCFFKQNASGLSK